MTYHLVAWTVVLRGGLVLLARRAGVSYGAGLWGLPGGHVEPGEPLAQAAAREVREEVGLIVSPDHLKPIGVTRYEAQGLQGCDWFFLTETFEGEPGALSECDRVGWFEPERLPPDALPWLARALETHLKRGEWFGESLEP